MTLKEFFADQGIKYTLWAKANDLPVSCVHRHLHRGGFFRPKAAKKIHQATGGKVDLISLCPELVDLVPSNGN